ncbi:MAG TPA: IS66 family transposase, partial [Planctomycetota bacterium]|nr:IS66 family transposase [Planctomycetota bacterium]
GRVCEDCPVKVELFGLRAQWGNYKRLHRQACEREKALKEKVQDLEARLRQRERELFAAKSERRRGARQPGESDATSRTRRRRRGHQRGAPGHGRKDYAHLPVREEWVELAEGNRRCPTCGLPFEAVGGSEDSELVEVEVRAYRRRLRRRRYRSTCRCAGLPAVIAAPRPPKLIPKGRYGVSVWVTVLLDKYASLRPTYRLVEDLRTHGLELSVGTVTDGLQRLAPLFEPLVAGIVARNVAEKHWHADETGWRVFVRLEGKAGLGWWLWVFAARSSVVFVLDRSRGRQVPETHLAGAEEGVLVVDRWPSYQSLAKVKAGKILLGFCWGHVRRDFLRVARDWPGQAAWGNEWLDAIGELFHLNALRREVLADPAAFASRDEALRKAVERVAERREAELGQADLHPARRRVMESLRNHWKGLTLFVGRPEVAMDNNEAERQLRGPVVGRKTFYGSGALWAGELAAALFSLFATLKRWKLNPRRWLTAYLEACAAHGGKPPPDAASFLPWNLPEARRRGFAAQPPPDT